MMSFGGLSCRRCPVLSSNFKIVWEPLDANVRKALSGHVSRLFGHSLNQQKQDALVHALEIACTQARIEVPSRKTGPGKPPITWLPILVHDVRRALQDVGLKFGHWTDDSRETECGLYSLTRICARISGRNTANRDLRWHARRSSRFTRDVWPLPQPQGLISPPS
jgi:hypothetical protein